jgi:hypothetical protein
MATIQEIQAALEQLKAKRDTVREQCAAALKPFDDKVVALERHLLSHYLDTRQIDAAISFYIAQRDEKDALKKQHTAALGVYGFNMDRIEKWFLNHFAETGQTSAGVKTAGTAARTTRTSVTMADPHAYTGWVARGVVCAAGIEDPDLADALTTAMTNAMTEWLEARVSKSAVEAYIANDNELPPGVNRSVDYTVSITRPKTR